MKEPLVYIGCFTVIYINTTRDRDLRLYLYFPFSYMISNLVIFRNMFLSA